MKQIWCSIPGLNIPNFRIAAADCARDIGCTGNSIGVCLSSNPVSALCHRPGFVGIGVGFNGLFKSKILKPCN